MNRNITIFFDKLTKNIHQSLNIYIYIYRLSTKTILIQKALSFNSKGYYYTKMISLKGVFFLCKTNLAIFGVTHVANKYY